MASHAGSGARLTGLGLGLASAMTSASLSANGRTVSAPGLASRSRPHSGDSAAASPTSTRLPPQCDPGPALGCTGGAGAGGVASLRAGPPPQRLQGGPLAMGAGSQAAIGAPGLHGGSPSSTPRLSSSCSARGSRRGTGFVLARTARTAASLGSGSAGPPWPLVAGAAAGGGALTLPSPFGRPAPTTALRLLRPRLGGHACWPRPFDPSLGALVSYVARIAGRPAQ